MISFLRRIFSRPQKTAPNQPVQDSSPVSVRFDAWGIYVAGQGQEQGKIAWDEITLIAIRIEDSFLPFPYWYFGNKNNLLRVPNDAVGAKELFFEGFTARIPGYHSDATFRTIIEASGALEGSFLLWKAPDGSD